MGAQYPPVELMFESLPVSASATDRWLGPRDNRWRPPTTEEHAEVVRLLVAEGIAVSPEPRGYPRAEMGGFLPLIALSVALLPFLKTWQEELAKDSYVGLKRLVGRLYERLRQRYERGGQLDPSASSVAGVVLRDSDTFHDIHLSPTTPVEAYAALAGYLQTATLLKFESRSVWDGHIRHWRQQQQSPSGWVPVDDVYWTIAHGPASDRMVAWWDVDAQGWRTRTVSKAEAIQRSANH